MSASVNVANATAQIELQHAVITLAESDIQSAEAAVTFAQEELDRYSKLAKTLAGTVQNQQRASADLRQRKADLLKVKAALETEHKRETVLETAKNQAEAEVSRAQAVLEQAKVNLGYTEIRAPKDCRWCPTISRGIPSPATTRNAMWIPLSHHAEGAKVPDAKSVPVRILKG